MIITGITAKGMMADHNDLGMHIATIELSNILYITHSISLLL